MLTGEEPGGAGGWEEGGESDELEDRGELGLEGASGEEGSGLAVAGESGLGWPASSLLSAALRAAVVDDSCSCIEASWLAK